MLRQQHIVDGLRAPGPRRPDSLVDAHVGAVERHRADIRRDITCLLERNHRHEHLAARLATLGRRRLPCPRLSIVQITDDDDRVSREDGPA